MRATNCYEIVVVVVLIATAKNKFPLDSGIGTAFFVISSWGPKREGIATGLVISRRKDIYMGVDNTSLTASALAWFGLWLGDTDLRWTGGGSSYE